MNTKHKFHELLQWIADGETVEYSLRTGGWGVEEITDIIWGITHKPELYSPSDFRIKPKQEPMYINKLSFSGGRMFRPFEVDINIKTYAYQLREIEAFHDTGTPVKIVSEQWYNEQINKQT
jgi:hypothetical protein